MAIENTYLTGSGVQLGTSHFDLQAQKPLDSRTTVPAYAGLQALIDGKAAYEGMIVYDEETKKTYQAHKVDGVLTFREFGINQEELKDLIASETTAAMEFKGATATLPESPAKGDMWKVTASFEVAGETAKVGDSIVYNGEEWFRIPSGDDVEDTWRPITDVDNSATLTFAAGDKLDVTVSTNGTITYKHEAIDAPTATPIGEDEQTRTYIASIETDGFGHITGYKTATENVEDTNTTYEFEGLPVGEDEDAPSSVYFQVKSSEEEAAEVIYLDTYSKNEADGKFAKAGDLGDLASKDKVSSSDFDDALSFSVIGWNSTQTTVSQNVEKWNTTADTVAQGEQAWDTAYEKARTALQEVKVLGVSLTKDSNEITVGQAKTALGLGALAYEDSVDVGVTDVKLESGTNNGTLKLTVNGSATDNIAVKGLGTAAYESKDSFVATTGDQSIAGKKTFANNIELVSTIGDEYNTPCLVVKYDGEGGAPSRSTTYDNGSIKVENEINGSVQYLFNHNSDKTFMDDNAWGVTIATREFVEAQGYVKDVSDKADRVANATGGNFAGLDANGNLTDSGMSADDFVLLDDYVAYSYEEKNKLAGIEAGAQVNKIEEIKVIEFGSNQIVASVKDKTATLDLSNLYVANAAHLEGKALSEVLASALSQAKTTIQGETTNTVEECVNAINKMNNVVDENIGTVENIVSQLTWGSF